MKAICDPPPVPAVQRKPDLYTSGVCACVHACVRACVRACVFKHTSN